MVKLYPEENKPHKCEGEMDDSDAGISECFEDNEGRLWVTAYSLDNDYTISRANYCPFCGFKAEEQAKIKKYKTFFYSNISGN